MSTRMGLQFHYEMSYLKQHRQLVGLPPRPPRFGRSSGIEHSLPLELIRPLQPLHEALGGQVAAAPGGSDLTMLATVAHYTLGLMRYEPTDLYPLHRPAPSPRCLYASQLYYFAAQPLADGLPGGLYRFHPVRHGLEPRPLAEGSPLSRWLAEHVKEGPGAWLLASAQDRIAHLYGVFAGRLSLLESGHVISQLRLVSGALGLATEVVPCFKDPLVSEGLDEGEIPLALIRHRAPESRAAGAGTPGIASPCPRPWLGTSLYRAILRRNSAHGPGGVFPVPVSLSAADIAGLAWYAMEECRATPQAETLGLQLYLAISNSDDLEPAFYRWSALQRALERIGPLSPASASGMTWARTLFNSTGFVARLCPVIAILAADLQAACSAEQEQGYFRALEHAGRVAQRLSLAAAARGLFARPAVSLDEAATDRLLGLHLGRGSAFYTVLIGQDRDMGFPVRLAL